jgi:riboflavin synthase
MFTGLIEDVGTLVARRPQGRAAKLEVQTGLALAELRVGDSVAVNGACLTVEAVQAASSTLVFYTLTETLERTNLGRVPAGGRVNLERALRLGDRLGGHLLLGHVDTTAAVKQFARQGDDWHLTVELPACIKALVIPKGSIAVDGISLTIARLDTDAVTVCIIPHTLAATNLRWIKAGSLVNLEADMIGKYILRQREVAESAGVNMDDLARAGFAG